MKNKTNKKLFLTASLAAVVALSACTAETPKDEAEKEDKVSEVSKETGKVDKKTDKKDNKKEIKKEEVVYDQDGIKVTYLGYKFKEDEFFGDSMEFKFDVKNDLERAVEVQAENVSADGRMINDMNISMSDSIAAGKIGTATLTIDDYEDGLPEEFDELELTLNIFDWEDYDFDIEVPVKVKTK